MTKKRPDKPKEKPKAKKKKKKTTLQIVEVARPGKYRITAPDLLQSIALRKRLQDAIERLKETTKNYVEHGVESGAVRDEDAQEILEAVDEIDGAVVPIAYGVFEGEDGEDGEDGGG
ncbi:MAG TPA: hypothetical protein VJP86_04700 [Vicinamibacterales bacterium]|jgi:predicted RNase H-like HicB family nuclease|nr:hypothetical protein [Vicinamibacterales bacterium]